MASYLIASDAGDGYYNAGDTPNWHQTGDGGHNDYVVGGRIGLVFESIPIPYKAHIVSATIDLYGFGASPGTATIKMIITGFAQDNAAVFLSDGSNEPGTRTATSASVAWEQVFPFSFARRSSPDISTILQEIVNRSGWATGQNIGFKIADNGTSSGNMASVDYSGSAVDCAQLTVTYDLTTTSSSSSSSSSTSSTSSSTSSTSSSTSHTTSSSSTSTTHSTSSSSTSSTSSSTSSSSSSTSSTSTSSSSSSTSSTSTSSTSSSSSSSTIMFKGVLDLINEAHPEYSEVNYF